MNEEERMDNQENIDMLVKAAHLADNAIRNGIRIDWEGDNFHEFAAIRLLGYKNIRIEDDAVWLEKDGIHTVITRDSAIQLSMEG